MSLGQICRHFQLIPKQFSFQGGAFYIITHIKTDPVNMQVLVYLVWSGKAESLHFPQAEPVVQPNKEQSKFFVFKFN